MKNAIECLFLSLFMGFPICTKEVNSIYNNINIRNVIVEGKVKWRVPEVTSIVSIPPILVCGGDGEGG